MELELVKNEKAVTTTATQLKRYQTELNLTEAELKRLNVELKDSETKLSGLDWTNAGKKMQEVGQFCKRFFKIFR